MAPIFSIYLICIYISFFLHLQSETSILFLLVFGLGLGFYVDFVVRKLIKQVQKLSKQ